MAIVFAARSDNSTFSARYNPKGRLTPGLALQASAISPPLYEVDATAIGGNRWNLDRANNVSRRLIYPTPGLTTSRAISVLMRVSIPVAGTLTLFEKRGGSTYNTNSFLTFFATNDWRISAFNASNQGIWNNNTIQTAAPTLNAYIDIVWTWTGDTTANGLKLWVDGVNVASLTAPLSWLNPLDPLLTDVCMIGGDNVRYYFNECAVWDTVITPTSIGLVSGTGSLNGASRNSFVDVISLDGSLNTSAGAANIRSGVNEVIAGVTIPGSMVGNAPTEVQHGVLSDGGLGTYRGLDLWTNTNPGAIMHGELTLQNGVEVEGTYRGYDLWTPIAGSVLKAGEEALQDGEEIVGEFIPECDYPEDADVREDVIFDSNGSVRRGTLDLASGEHLRLGITQDGGDIIGTLDSNAEEIEIEVEDTENILIEVED